MGAVNGIARLKCDDALPAFGIEQQARFPGIKPVIEKVFVTGPVEQADFPAQTGVSGSIEILHSRVALIGGL